MAQYEILYPKLKYFFSAYFHQDWKSIYDWHGEKPAYQIVVHDFKANNPAETVQQASLELETLLGLDLSEASLREIVVHKLGANIYAPGLGFTYRQWLQEVLKILNSPV